MALGEDEFVELEQEQKRLANSGDLALNCQRAIELLNEGEEVNALGLLQSVSHTLIDLAEMDSKLTALPSMVAEALINLKRLTMNCAITWIRLMSTQNAWRM